MNTASGYTDINEINEAQKKLSELYNAKSKVLLEEIPGVFQAALNKFITGRTMPVHLEKPAMYYSDFVDFFNSLWNRK